MSTAPQELAIPGTHERLLPIIAKAVPPSPTTSILDLGAGQGAMSQRLLRAGYAVRACDLFPEMFRCAEIQCDPVDAHERLPYEGEQFDAVVAVEVVEHLESHGRLFSEVSRVLKPGGKFIFSTPNISSLKSRVMFLLTGYFYSHGPLNPDEVNPVRQHVSAFTPDRYRFVLARNELELLRCETDKYQKSSLYLSWLWPLLRLAAARRFGIRREASLMDSRSVLLGRTLVGVAQKKLSQPASSGAERSNPTIALRDPRSRPIPAARPASPLRKAS